MYCLQVLQMKRKSESPAPKDNDWLVELTKDEAAFCTKVMCPTCYSLFKKDMLVGNEKYVLFP